MHRFAKALFVAASTSFLLPTPVTAAPQAVRIDKIYDAGSCGTDVCPAGTRTISADATVDGNIQIHVHAEDPLGLRYMRLEARFGTNPEWICIQEWERRGQLSADGWYTWNSAIWPKPKTNSDCTELSKHFHNTPTQNANTILRVKAANYVDDQATTTSPTFTVTLANPPAAPTWAQDPTTNGRNVTLAWTPGAEADLREYRWIRLDPDGSDHEFAISATKPEQAGCARIGTTMVRCTDTTVPASGGTFRYAILSLRPAKGGPTTCAIGGGACIESPPSTQKTVTVAASGQSPAAGSPAASGEPTLTTVPSDPQQESPAPEATEPAAAPVTVGESDRREQLAAASDNEASDGAFPVVPAALGFLAASFATVGTVLARRRKN